MRGPTTGWVADAAGAALRAGDAAATGPRRAVVDTRAAAAGDLFVGLRGERADGGAFASAALEAGAWGALVAPEHAARAAAAAPAGAAVLAAEDPLASLQALARAWRRRRGERYAGVAVRRGGDDAGL